MLVAGHLAWSRNCFQLRNILIHSYLLTSHSQILSCVFFQLTPMQQIVTLGMEVPMAATDGATLIRLWELQLIWWQAARCRHLVEKPAVLDPLRYRDTIIPVPWSTFPHASLSRRRGIDWIHRQRATAATVSWMSNSPLCTIPIF